MSPTHLFIDTNVLLNFYSYAEDDLDQLEQLIAEIGEDRLRLHLPQQVVNELARNRETKLKLASDQFRKEALPSAVPRHMQAYAQHLQYVEAVESARKLRDQLVSLAAADASNQTLKTDVLMRELFEKASRYAEDNEVYARALQRMQKGNPPGKAGSVGDQYNWEVLLEEVSGPDLYIVSKDGDYTSLLNKQRPHPSLEAEWRERKGGTLHVYAEVRSFLKRYREMLAQVVIQEAPPLDQPVIVGNLPPVVEQPVPIPLPPAPVPPPPPPPPPLPRPVAGEEIDPHLAAEKDEAINALVNSGSFASTHAAIARLNFYRHLLSPQDIERLVRAAVSNDQICWIATDSDVYSFFVSLITEHSFIDADLLDAAIDAFGLRPEPEDPYDD